MSKNIVVFSDGTGQEGGERYNTNIYKLFNMLEDRTSRQIAFYDRGLGTGWRKITGKVSGAGISQNIQECYRFIFDNFEAGDQIFLFGFSRGAATVRSLSSFIHYFGILPKSRPELISRAYRIYKYSDDGKRKDAADEFVGRHHTMWTRIKLIGCFDTVAALGIPIKFLSVCLDSIPFFKHKFHNFQLSESVENAFHALAIDDQRKTFHPVLWDPRTLDYQKIKQVWFCGMHTDVGGGYREQTLSDIPLVWMMQQSVAHGLRIYPRHRLSVNEDADGILHDSRGTRMTKLYRKKRRTWDSKERGKPVVHESVLKRRLNEKNEPEPPYHPWIVDMEYAVEEWVRDEDR